MRERLKSIIFSISVIVITLLFLAVLEGISFYIYSILTVNYTELEASTKFLTISTAILIPFILIAISLRNAVLIEILDAIVVVSIAWIVIPAVNALIYSYTIGIDYIDGFFESISGFTGTGLTIFSRPEDLPYTILIWRASTQWIGELSVIVFSTALLPYIHRVLGRVYIVERGVKLGPTILSTSRRLLAIYVFLTSLGVLMLMLSGMSFLDALAHSMTGIATGGMSTNSQSIGFWYNVVGYKILITSIIIMVFGALNFVDLHNLFRGKIKKFFKSLEVKWFLYISIFLVVAVVIVVLTCYGFKSEILVLALYNTISGLTTTGFQVGNIGREYNDILKLVIIVAMAIGGATFSTAGGIKIKRVVIALKSLGWSFAKPFILERVYFVKRIGEEIIEEEDISSTYAYITFYSLTAIFFSAALYIVLNISGYTWSRNYIDVLFEIVSALSCVGLSTGITSISMPIYAKILLIIAMYLGRLEFAPIYILVGYWYKSKVTL
jgi:trk system potassium uptake protein TrkH